KNSTGPTGPTRNWPTTCARPEASRPPAAPPSASLPGSASGRTGRPTTASVATPPCRPGPRRIWPTWKKAAGELVLPSRDEARFPTVPTLAPWQRGRRVGEALRDNTHLEFKRLPSHGPRLDPTERFWKWLRRRA